MDLLGLYRTLLDHKMVEAAGIEPASENRQHRTSTCVAAVLNFASVHAPQRGLERLLAQYGFALLPWSPKVRLACFMPS